MTTLLSPKVFVLPLLALVVIASLPRQSETTATPSTTTVACAASLPSDAVTRRQTSKPVCEPGRGHVAQERVARTVQ